jgi:thioredoxin 2
VAARGSPRCGACSSPLPWLVEARDADFDAAIRESQLPVLVDVWAPWCGPCRTVTPIVEQIARERAGALKVVKLNADQAPRSAGRLGVQGIPTLALFVDGRERGRVVGAQPPNTLREWLDRQLRAAS